MNASGKLDVRTFNQSWKKHIVNHKYAKERAQKGYCFYDILDIDAWFLRVMIDILTEYRIMCNRIPNELILEEYAANKQDYPHLNPDTPWHTFSQEAMSEQRLLDERAHQRWKDIITVVITEFETVERLSEEIYNYTNDYEDAFSDLQQHLGKAFALLQKWLFDLWL